jgi:hypothetical protein
LSMSSIKTGWAFLLCSPTFPLNVCR